MSVYDISNAERPVQIQNVVLSGSGGLFQIDIDGSNSYFYALTRRNEAGVPFTGPTPCTCSRSAAAAP